MSKYSTVSMFIGHNGDSVWLAGGSEWPDFHPIVLAYPEYFTDTPPGGAPKPASKRPKPSAKTSQRQEPAGD